MFRIVGGFVVLVFAGYGLVHFCKTWIRTPGEVNGQPQGE